MRRIHEKFFSGENRADEATSASWLAGASTEPKQNFGKPLPKQSMEVVDASKHLFFGDSVVGVSTPLRGGPDMQDAWLAYARQNARSPK